MNTPPPVRLISNATLWQLHRAQGRTGALYEWAGANGLTPDDVSADHPITIEDTPDGRLIRCRVFVRGDNGLKQGDPTRYGEALTEDRTVPLAVEPPDDWPVYAQPGPA
ncbi:hypothetical protein [Streptomyces sp. H27-C3]|uniref:hypothetical protein n=1 Tax=Streptomyces sp. H27-C3 TaxID=3046305 RepID=UPI0024B8C845|nr:hypothetical protein [Streptomyces sp. H27-C3]MDJ0460618.1 hypothetical protein [Streptomyces sp. H27-C3]